MGVWSYGRGGAGRPPVLVVALGVTFLLLIAALLIGSLAEPEFPPYPPTPPAPVAVGDSLVGPAVYTVDASAPAEWRRFDFSRNSVVDAGDWDIAFRRTHVRAAAGVGIGSPRIRADHQVVERALDAGVAGNLVGPPRAGHEPLAARKRDDARLLPVVLIADLTDELLDEVLERHDAGGAAVLVDDDGEGGARSPKLAQQRVELRGLRHDKRLGHQRDDRGRGPAVGRDAQHILRLYDAAHLVEAALADDREARMAALDRHPAQVLGRRVRGDRHHLRSRDHRVGGIQPTEREHPGQQGRLRTGQDAARSGLADDDAELLVGHAAPELLHRLDADRPQERVRRAVEQADHRAGDREVAPHRRGQGTRETLGLGDADGGEQVDRFPPCLRRSSALMGRSCSSRQPRWYRAHS